MEEARRAEAESRLADRRRRLAAQREILFENTTQEVSRRMCLAADSREGVVSGTKTSPYDEETAKRLEVLDFDSWLDVIRAFGAAGKKDAANDCQACDSQFLKSLDFQLVYNDKKVQESGVELYVHRFVLENDRDQQLVERLAAIVPSVTPHVHEFSLSHVVRAYPLVFSSLVGRRLSLNEDPERILPSLCANAARDFNRFAIMLSNLVLHRYPLLKKNNSKLVYQLVCKSLQPAVVQVVAPLFVRWRHSRDLRIQKACRFICSNDSFVEILGKANFEGPPLDATFLGSDWASPSFEKLQSLCELLERLSAGCAKGLDDLMPVFLHVLVRLVGENSDVDYRIAADASLLEAFVPEKLRDARMGYAVVTFNAATAFLAELECENDA